MAYGVFLAIIGGCAIIASAVAMFILLAGDKSPFKNGMHYVLAIGCLVMGISHMIVTNPKNIIANYYANCIDKYEWRTVTVTGTTIEKICADGTANYKKKVLGL